jgi:chromosome segregation ATPase
MTIEERFEFLRQSIEARDRKLGEITRQLANLTIRQDRLATKIDQLTIEYKSDDGLIDKLIASMHALDISINNLPRIEGTPQ